MEPKDTLSDYLYEALRQSAEMEYNVHDMSRSSDNEIIEYFKSLKLSNYKPGSSVDSQFYGGITNNIKQNLSRHSIDNYIGCVKVNSKNTAARIEQLLQDELGFDIGAAPGGNGAAEDTIYVYMASKCPPFVK
jgi:hypothetical protein